VSARAVFADFVGSGVLSGRWTLGRWPRSSVRLLTLGFVAVALSWPVRRRRWRTGCGGCWALLRALSLALGGLVAAWVVCCAAGCAGSACLAGSSFFGLAVAVRRCLGGRAPPCLSGCCVPVSGAGTRRHLRSANRHLGLIVMPRFRLNTYGRRAFSVAGPMA